MDFNSAWSNNLLWRSFGALPWKKCMALAAYNGAMPFASSNTQLPAWSGHKAPSSQSSKGAAVLGGAGGNWNQYDFAPTSAHRACILARPVRF